LLRGEYIRAGGIIIDSSTGNVAYRLMDEAGDDYEGDVITLRVPGIMGATLRSLTFENLRVKFNEYIKIEFGAFIDAEQKAMLDRLVIVVDRIGSSGNSDMIGEDGIALLGYAKELEECYAYFKELCSYNIEIMDKRTNFYSFPLLKICVFIAICMVLVYLHLKKYYQCKEWLEEAIDLCVTAMKKYPAVFCKHISDVEHYENIAALSPRAYIGALKEIIMSPAGKPKIKFPPAEVIYLWSCYEFLEGYVYEIAVTDVMEGG
jgi:hypothetical protein